MKHHIRYKHGLSYQSRYVFEIDNEMNAAELLELMEEMRLAQAEQARALAQVKEARQQVEAARIEAENARAAECKYERDLELAADKLSEGLRALHVTMEAPTPALLPIIADYLVEYHANIGCYHCYLLIDGDAPSAINANEFRVRVDGIKVTIATASDIWWSVELERKVDATKSVITTKDDHVYLRLPVNESDKETADGFSSFSQTTQDELHIESYNNLRCRSCGLVYIEDSQRFEKVLPLPSENWMEMFDFWGAGIGSFEHIPREGIFAQERRIYVGESHIILHEDDLKDNSVANRQRLKVNSSASHPDHNERDTVDWENVCCAGCTAVIGHRRVENKKTVRLQKHLLAAASRETADVFKRYTIDSTISTQMLHIAETDGIFRFLLRSSDQATTVSDLQVQLLSWDTKIQTKSTAPDFQRVLKILYTNSSASSTSSLTQVDLPPMMRTQELVVTTAVGAEIAKHLEQNTLLLPTSQRSFNKMTVGYLYA